MPVFLRGPPDSWPELEQWHNNLGGSTWLNDGNIHSAYSMYRLADGSALPTTLKLLGPAEVQLLLHGQCGHRETLLEIDLDNRDLVIAPISDGKPWTPDSGSHWSFMVIYRVRRRGLEDCFASVHYDSASSKKNAKVAGQLGTKLPANMSYLVGSVLGRITVTIVACMCCSSHRYLLGLMWIPLLGLLSN